ncbi:MAG: aminodeoxychorismate synthase component [Hydrocarboniphaga sp.]|uniref:aminodeoxychorismate synthase component I n=1 Tax=Hydrocarboniphaga sp. TaxID=2033016 RepID=UPI00260B6A6B|nr:aminodeoxychorismate synthase component I [Hydrocarboniphaga sp.]MDB5968059.1 aminodeoxychorismate synthase component [Hydrocarboniphaga sp.]
MGIRAERAGEVDLFDLHRRNPARYPFLLQSVAGHPVSGRYDLLFGFPGDTISGAGFFDRLAEAYAAERVLPDDDRDLPFVGGWFVLLGYEVSAQIEPRLQLPPSPHRLPDALAVRCPAVAIFDRTRRVTTVYAETESAQIDAMLGDLDAPPPPAETAPDIGAAVEDEANSYLAGVRRILQYLRAGDIFQANLSRAWRAPLRSGTAASVYARLRGANPAPFAGIVQWQGSSVLSSSPERLLRIEDGVAETRPIAGTRPRGRDAAEDALLREHLLENVKERAEHVMLIDLERNDLGRVCRPGSVEVSELMTVESYAHVHHIVSNIRGRLQGDAGPVDALRAVFPGGTITGCPKVRAMEILAELEVIGRGPYTGAMGYLSRCGRLDTNILIRSFVLEDGVISFRAGAGIVADSEPEAELAETRAKARGLLLALGAA